MAACYTNESRWDLSDGYFGAYVNAISDRKFIYPIYFFSNYASYTAHSVSTYCITQPMSKHFGSTTYHYDQHDYAWLKTQHGDELTYLFGTPSGSAANSPIWTGRFRWSSCDCGRISHDTATCLGKRTARSGPLRTEKVRDRGSSR